VAPAAHSLAFVRTSATRAFTRRLTKDAGGSSSSRKPDGPLRGLVARESARVSPPNVGRDGIEAAVVFPRGVPHERSPVEPEAGNAVAEGSGGGWRRGLDGLSERPEVLPRSVSRRMMPRQPQECRAG
jgi:hypothetical protein